MVFVQVRVPAAADSHMLDAIKWQVHELVAAVEQRQRQNVLTREAHAGDFENYSFVVWSREYSDQSDPSALSLPLEPRLQRGFSPRCIKGTPRLGVPFLPNSQCTAASASALALCR